MPRFSFYSIMSDPLRGETRRETEKLFRQLKFNPIFKDITSVNILWTRFKFDDILNQLVNHGSFPFSTWKYRHMNSPELYFSITNNSDAEILSNNNNQPRRTYKMKWPTYPQQLFVYGIRFSVERLDLDLWIWCYHNTSGKTLFRPFPSGCSTHSVVLSVIG